VSSPSLEEVLVRMTDRTMRANHPGGHLHAPCLHRDAVSFHLDFLMVHCTQSILIGGVCPSKIFALWLEPEFLGDFHDTLRRIGDQIDVSRPIRFRCGPCTGGSDEVDLTPDDYTLLPYYLAGSKRVGANCPRCGAKVVQDFPMGPERSRA